MGINQTREKLILKHFLTVTDIAKFIPCGRKKAQLIFDEISKEIEQENLVRCDLGISAERLLKYLGLNKQTIFKYAEMENDYVQSRS